MSISLADYLTRKSDVLAFDGFRDTAATFSQRITQTLAESGGSGKLCVGIIKLAQRFLLELLMDAASMPYNVNRGCLFLYEARVGLFRTPGDVADAFARAVSQISRNLRGDEVATDPDDERFGSAVLDSVEVTAGKVTIYVTLTSLAGADRHIILPVTITV